MFARGSGQEHWDEVKKFRKQHIQKWHELQGSAAQASKARNRSDGGSICVDGMGRPRRGRKDSL